MNINKNEVLAIIPARGSSKGLPRKNSRILVNKPLVAWSIDVACKAKTISRVVVSTDDEEVADIAVRHGAEVPFMRPKELAQDNSIIGDAIDYTLNLLAEEDYHPACVVELYPTSPFRTSDLIDCLTQKLLIGYSEVNTVKQIACRPSQLVVTDEYGKLKLLRNLEISDHPSVVYRAYSQFHGWRLIPHASEKRAKYFHIINDPIELIDIDYAEDFRLAEYIIENNYYRIT